jgi:hypothetical protein
MRYHSPMIRSSVKAAAVEGVAVALVAVVVQLVRGSNPLLGLAAGAGWFSAALGWSIARGLVPESGRLRNRVAYDLGRLSEGGLFFAGGGAWLLVLVAEAKWRDLWVAGIVMGVGLFVAALSWWDIRRRLRKAGRYG